MVVVLHVNASTKLIDEKRYALEKLCRFVGKWELIKKEVPIRKDYIKYDLTKLKWVESD